MNKKKVICITKFPFITVGGFGKFKNGDVIDFPENIANQLIRTEDFKLEKTKEKNKAGFNSFGEGKK